MKRRRPFRGASRGQALIDYVGLLLFVAGIVVAMFDFMVPVFRNQVMKRLIAAVVKPFTQ